MHSNAYNFYNFKMALYSSAVVMKGFNSSSVVYHTRISYRTRMVHTIRVYAYGTTVCVWYGYLYHMRMATILLMTYSYS